MPIVIETEYTVAQMKRWCNIHLRKARIIVCVTMAVVSLVIGMILSFALRSQIPRTEDAQPLNVMELVVMPLLMAGVGALFLAPRRTKEYDGQKVTLTFYEDEVHAEYASGKTATVYYNALSDVLREGDDVYFIGKGQPILFNLARLDDEERKAMTAFLCRRFRR